MARAARQAKQTSARERARLARQQVSAPRISALLGIEAKEVRPLGVERDRRHAEEAEEHSDGPDRGDNHN